MSKFKAGDRVRLINPNPEFGLGYASVGDVGVVKRVFDPDSVPEYKVNFPDQDSWSAMEVDLELVESIKTPQVTIPAAITFDEAVKECNTIRQEITKLQNKLKSYEAVITNAGLKFI